MQANAGGQVALMSWQEVEAGLSAGARGLPPVGAACKNRGLQLPMTTDGLQAEWLAARACEQRPHALRSSPLSAESYAPSGVHGDATLASAAEGRERLAAIGGDLLETPDHHHHPTMARAT